MKGKRPLGAAGSGAYFIRITFCGNSRVAAGGVFLAHNRWLGYAQDCVQKVLPYRRVKMKLDIIIDENLDAFCGKISQRTYENLPNKKQPVLYDNHVFYLGDLEHETIQIVVDDDIQIPENVLYLSEYAKHLYYPEKDSIIVS
jgi:hypothetical protein